MAEDSVYTTERQKEYWGDVRAGKRSGPDGQEFGTKTAESLGLVGGTKYGEGRLKPWLKQLRDWSAYLQNNPNYLSQYAPGRETWVRAAQLNYTPEGFGELVADVDLGNIPQSSLTSSERYVLGLSNEPPAGYDYAAPGAKPFTGYGGGGGGQSAQDWFADKYPSIARYGAGSSGARSKPSWWTDIYSGSGRWAPRIKTIQF